MTILKLTDNDNFGTYTSDDTELDGEYVDKFYTNHQRALGAGGEGRGLSLSEFYNIVPVPVTIHSEVKILVKIIDAE